MFPYIDNHFDRSHWFVVHYQSKIRSVHRIPFDFQLMPFRISFVWLKEKQIFQLITSFKQKKTKEKQRSSKH